VSAVLGVGVLLLNIKFASHERAVQNRHPHMLTENPTEVLTEDLTDDRPKI
jgi:hypothetical protein